MNRKTRIVQVDVEEWWVQCHTCGGDGKRRPIISHGFERTSSNMTGYYFEKRGPATEQPCDQCAGKGGYWERGGI